MSKLATVGAALIISVAVATPVFAQDGGLAGPGTHRSHAHYRESYNQSIMPSDAAPLTNEERRNLENSGWTGRDPSRPGGMWPYFNGGTGN